MSKPKDPRIATDEELDRLQGDLQTTLEAPETQSGAGSEGDLLHAGVDHAQGPSREVTVYVWRPCVDPELLRPSVSTRWSAPSVSVRAAEGRVMAIGNAMGKTTAGAAELLRDAGHHRTARGTQVTSGRRALLGPSPITRAALVGMAG